MEDEKYIKIFATGGTFDKEYNEINGELFFKKTHLSELLKLGRSQLNVKIETLMMVDSLRMSQLEKGYIVEKCKSEKTDRIIITHGTDTMIDTAKLIAKNIKNKTIILTGAMIPIKFGSSDGLFNIGSALSFIQVINPGVYITMNGRYFNWDNVRKNKKLGIFERINK
jgi:L-asparaginase